MDLDAYEKATRQHCVELIEELRKCDLAALSTACRKMGIAAMQGYLSGTDIETSEYVAAAPSVRKRLLRKVPEANRPLFLVAAAYQARCALNLLQAVCHRGVTAGPSYRMVTAQAAAAAIDMQKGWPTLWPFEPEADCPDPFDGA